MRRTVDHYEDMDIKKTWFKEEYQGFEPYSNKKITDKRTDISVVKLDIDLYWLNKRGYFLYFVKEKSQKDKYCFRPVKHFVFEDFIFLTDREALSNVKVKNGRFWMTKQDFHFHNDRYLVKNKLDENL